MKIEIGEHCFGPILRIDDKPIIDYGYDDYKLNEDLVKIIFDLLNSVKDKISKEDMHELMSTIQGRSSAFAISDEEYDALKDEEYEAPLMCEKINYNISLIIDEIFKSRNEFDGNDWGDIISILMSKLNFKKNEKESYRSDCDQCGNWNYLSVYYN